MHRALCCTHGGTRLIWRAGGSGAQGTLSSSTPLRAPQRHLSPCSCSPDPGASASSSQQQGDEGPGLHFSYKSDDGRTKATFETVFKDASGPITGSDTPWQFNYQMNERVLVWSDDLRGRLVKHIMAQELGVTDDEAETRLEELVTLMPDLEPKLSVMKPSLLARMAADTSAVARCLLRLKAVLPGANVSLMVTRYPDLVIGELPPDKVAEAVDRLRELLPRSDVDKLVQEHPVTMLDVEGFEMALDKARTMLPNLDLEKTLASNPGFIFGFERRAKQIPYDE